MGSIHQPRDVMLFSSVIYSHDPLDAIEMLKSSFGEIAFSSKEMAFDYTDYYEHEMGRNLKRIMIAFDKLVPRDYLSDAKIISNEIEEKFLNGPNRKINIDPGILSLENVCLATTKPYSHRIYLSRGIWAEVTLIFRNDRYSALEWTYPDYASSELEAAFLDMRNIYKGRLKSNA